VAPDAISVIAVTRSEIVGVLKRIAREPLTFGATEWFGLETVGSEILDLLPPKSMESRTKT
jgi:hypothetical protein